MELTFNLIPYAVTTVAIVIAWAAQRWFGLILKQSHIDSILMAIINEIIGVEIEETNKKRTDSGYTLTGFGKKLEVLDRVNNKFNDSNNKVFTSVRRNLLEKTFGSMEISIEKAFQMSHLAGISK